MNIYTRAGDTGRASTLTRRNIPKDSPVFAVLGTLDELSSAVGVAKTQAPQLTEVLEQIQRDLIGVCGELAGGEKFAKPDRVVCLEKAIDAAAAQTPEFSGFVLPGGTPGGAALDLARTVARRAERCAVTASQTGGITRDMLAWLNRLSDLLYVLARLCDRGETDPPQAANAAPAAADAPGQTATVTLLSSDGFCDTALRLCTQVRQYAAEQGVRVVTAVCDAGGQPVAMLRADDAFIASVDIAMNKAFTAVALKMSTEELAPLAQPGGSLYGIQHTNSGRIVIFGGGVPLIMDGRIIGGFGVSGGTAAQDTAFGRYAKALFEKELR